METKDSAHVPVVPCKETDGDVQFDEKDLRPAKYLSEHITKLKSLISPKSFVDTYKFKEFSDHVDFTVEGHYQRKWKRHFLVIKNKTIKLYKKLTSNQPYISINLDTVTCEVFVVKNSVVLIQPKEFSKCLLIRPLSQNKLEDCCITIHFNLTRSVGFNVHLVDLCYHSRKFWRKSYITANQFFDICEHGDLMLFKTSGFGGFALRVASNSEFDHVGLLLRGKKSEIFLYECLGLGGVQVNSIEFFLDNDWDQFYEKIVIRKLVFARTEEFSKSLKKACSQWLGKPYKLTAEKLMRRNSLNNKKENFFCSELVAAVYKKVGLLPDDLSASQYWPSSFSANHKVDLQKGAYLGEEMRIIFHQ